MGTVRHARTAAVKTWKAEAIKAIIRDKRIAWELERRKRAGK